jgi:flagellar protein FlgJ
MMTPSVSGIGGTPVDPQETKLRKAAADLQGMFVQQLFKSMRDSVPKDSGLVDQSQGEELFTGLMDERLAADTGSRWHRGLGDAIYRALRSRAGLDEAPAAPASVPPASAPTAPVHATPAASPVRTP